MNVKVRSIVTLAAIAGAVGCWISFSRVTGADNEAPVSAEAMDFAAQERAAVEARTKDPAWKPACDQVGLIQVGKPGTTGTLKNFCLAPDGNLLACVARVAGEPGPGIRVYSPQGVLLRTLPLEINPGAICAQPDGTIFVAGEGRLLKLDAAGKVLASAPSPVAQIAVTITPEMEEMIKESGRPAQEERDRLRTTLEQRRGDVTGLAVTAQDVFMAVPAPNDFTFQVYRFDHDLQQAKRVVEKLRGCCGQMDIQTHEGRLWIPHNARHQVESRDREGAALTKFGKAGKVRPSDFGGCCEPKCLRVLPSGDILAAESGPPTCIKRFTAEGKFLGVVALSPAKGECVRVTVDASADGRRFYLLDTEKDAIRVYAPKG